MATICNFVQYDAHKSGQLFGTNLVWACDDSRKVLVTLLLSFSHGLEDARVVRAQVDEAVSDASLPKGLEQS